MGEVLQAVTVVAPPDPMLKAAVGGGIGLGLLGLTLAFAVTVQRAADALPRIPSEPSAPVAPRAAPARPAPPPGPTGLVARLRAALERSREALQGRFDVLFGGRPVNDDLFDELEMTLLTADVGVPTTARLLDPLRELAKAGADGPKLRAALREGMKGVLSADPKLAPPEGAKPWVILVVGVNGSGKTTTIGKLATNLQKDGKKVLLAAGDTFRAAAIEQLQVWAERSGADIVAQQEGADPGAVVFDALSAAVAKGADVVIIDTAGRLQTRKPLMDQLSKIRRVIDKVVPGAPHETLLVVDGTMGQNALSQASLFNEATPLTGAVITKLDGTAKGGMVLSLASELNLPIKLIGIGEKAEDLKPFDAAAFVEALT